MSNAILQQVQGELTKTTTALVNAQKDHARLKAAFEALEDQFADLDTSVQELRSALEDVRNADTPDASASAQLRALRAEQDGMRAELAALYIALQSARGES